MEINVYVTKNRPQLDTYNLQSYLSPKFLRFNYFDFHSSFRGTKGDLVL